MRSTLRAREKELNETHAIAESATKRTDAIKADYDKQMVKLEASLDMLQKVHAHTRACVFMYVCLIVYIS